MDFPNAMSFSPYTTNFLSRRDCLECPDITPSCPTCLTNEVCVQVSRNCTTCPYRQCVRQQDSGATNPQGSSSGSHSLSKGAIIGGILGGLIVVALVTYLVWRFWIKKRRAAWIEDFEDELEESPEKANDEPLAPPPVLGGGAGAGRDSVASSVLTRASNVIPIAFIPGIIDRSGAAPPVPPVPIPTHTTHGVTTTLISPYSDHNGDTYFMPGDLRDSTYSGFTSTTSGDNSDAASTHTGRTSMITDNMARASVTSTIYNADVNQAHALVQTAQRARPAMVSVRPGNSRANSPPPAVPRVDYDRYGAGVQAGNSSSRSSGSNQDNFSLNSVLVSNVGTSAPASPGSSTPAQGLSRGPSAVRSGPPPQLAAVIEEATRRASRTPVHGGLGSLRGGGREEGPFGDQHALEEEDEDE